METNYYGYLSVITRTARGVVPVGGVLITVSSGDVPDYGVYASRRSGRDGKVEPIRLPTAPLNNSMQPDGGVPCSKWNIDADIDGYYPVRNVGMQVYPDVTSIQEIELVPVALGTGNPPEPVDDVNFDESQLPNL